MSGTIESEDTPVYPASLLSGLDLTQSHVTFSPPLTIHQPGQDLRIRPLHIQVSTGSLPIRNFHIPLQYNSLEICMLAAEWTNFYIYRSQNSARDAINKANNSQVFPYPATGSLCGKQCSGSVESIHFWASRIRIRKYLNRSGSGFGSFHQLAKKCRKLWFQLFYFYDYST